MIFFNELLYRCMRRAFGNVKLSKDLQAQEMKTQFRIYQITLKMQKNQARELRNKQVAMSNMISKNKEVNPFLTIMMFNVSFRAWHRISRKQLTIFLIDGA